MAFSGGRFRQDVVDWTYWATPQCKNSKVAARAAAVKRNFLPGHFSETRQIAGLWLRRSIPPKVAKFSNPLFTNKLLTLVEAIFPQLMELPAAAKLLIPENPSVVEIPHLSICLAAFVHHGSAENTEFV